MFKKKVISSCLFSYIHICIYTFCLLQAVDWQWVHQRRTLSRASWALGPPNTLRYRNIKQPSLSHLFSYTAKAQRGASEEGEWDESLSVCVMVQQGESNSLHTLLEIPLSQYVKLGDVFNLGSQRSSELFLPMTMVDGRREDDISVESCLSRGVAGAEREHGCFRSLFEAERCPAPFMNGSQFYCFHCPGTEPASELHYRKEAGLDQSSEDLHVLLSSYLCSHGQQGSAVHTEGDGEREEQMALMYERLRIEVRMHLMSITLFNILACFKRETKIILCVQCCHSCLESQTSGFLKKMNE